MADSPALAAAIQRLHNATAIHLASEPVTLRAGEEILWDGVVEVFDLKGHPTARRAFGWTFRDGDGRSHHVAILSVPQVDTPLMAVRAWLVQSAQKTKPRRKVR